MQPPPESKWVWPECTQSVFCVCVYVHKFSENLWATSQFQEPEGQHTSFILRTHTYSRQTCLVVTQNHVRRKRGIAPFLLAQAGFYLNIQLLLDVMLHQLALSSFSCTASPWRWKQYAPQNVSNCLPVYMQPHPRRHESSSIPERKPKISQSSIFSSHPTVLSTQHTLTQYLAYKSLPSWSSTQYLPLYFLPNVPPRSVHHDRKVWEQNCHFFHMSLTAWLSSYLT